MVTHLETDILECEVKWALEAFLRAKLVEVMNRFKGLNLIECLKNYGQRFITLYRRQ